MLYEEILLAAVILLAMALPAGMLLAFRNGYRTGRAVHGDGELPRLAAGMLRRQTKRVPSAEQERLNRLLQNINTYDGTGKGQEVIR